MKYRILHARGEGEKRKHETERMTYKDEKDKEIVKGIKINSLYRQMMEREAVGRERERERE